MERQHGRVPEDVSTRSLGHDVHSEAPNGEAHYIEVKARTTTGAIVLAPDEWRMAQHLSDDCWLYIGENATSTPRIHTIPNLAARLASEEIRAIV